MNIETVQYYQIDQFDRIPETTGIYCWLAQPNLEVFSVQDGEFDTPDEGLDSLIFELTELMHSTRQQDMCSSVSAFFGTKWVGNLTHASSADRSGTPAQKTRKSCQTAASQQLLSKLITASFPTFWQPLYIGVAKNLKTRLLKHQRAYALARTGEAEFIGNESTDDASTEAGNLAARLVSCAFRPEHLRIAIISIGNIGEIKSTEQARQIAETAESWLNHFNSPRLGRL